MLELFVIACVGARACEYLTVPHAYPAETSCAHQAALFAGMMRGRHADHAGTELSVEFTCRPVRDRGTLTASRFPAPGVSVPE